MKNLNRRKLLLQSPYLSDLIVGELEADTLSVLAP